MTIYKKAILLFAAVAALSTAQALSLVPTSGMPAPGKIGGLTAVLPDASWQSCMQIGSLDYRDESVAPSSLSHDEPLCRVSVRNLLPVPRTLKISAGASHSADSHRIVALEPMATATVTLPVVFAFESGSHNSHHIFITEPNPPAAAVRAHAGRAFENIKLANRTTEYYESHKVSGDHANPSLLLSDGIARDAIRPSFKDDFDTVELRRKADDWPRDFRAYLPFDAVCLAKDVEAVLSDEARTALRAYELLGGEVMTMEDGAQPPKDIESRAKAAQTRRTGDLETTYYTYKYHPGNTFSDNVEKVPIQVGRSLPVGILIAFLALVALVIMPAMVWYCAKKNRRLLLLAALPGSALALTVVVALVALAAYGTTPTVRVQAVTILDPQSRLAVTRGQFAVFAPGQATGKMSIPADASFRLRGRADGHLEAQFGEACRLEGDWIKPLSAAFFDFERAERRSERLDVKRGPGEGVTVANLLGSPVVGGQLQLDGKRYKIPSLAPGEQTTIVGIPFAALSAKSLGSSPAEELAETFFGKSGEYGREWDTTQKIVNSERFIIPAETYIVRVAGSPFFPSPLAGTKSYETAEAVVAGCVAPEDGKEAAK